MQQLESAIHQPRSPKTEKDFGIHLSSSKTTQLWDN